MKFQVTVRRLNRRRTRQVSTLDTETKQVIVNRCSRSNEADFV